MALRKAIALDMFVCEEPTGTTVIPIAEGPDHDPAEVLMHVRTSSESKVWHKRITGIPRTSCDEAYDYSSGAVLRNEVLEGDLCPKCFTPFELALAAARNRQLAKDVT